MTILHGMFLIGDDPVFVPTWVELRFDGQQVWRKEVPEMVLKQRKEVEAKA